MAESGSVVPEGAIDFKVANGPPEEQATAHSEQKIEKYADPLTVPWSAEQIQNPENLLNTDVEDENTESRKVYYGVINGLDRLGIKPAIIKGKKQDSYLMAYPIDTAKKGIGETQGNQRTYLVLYRNGHATEMVLPCNDDGSLSEDLQLDLDQMPVGANAFDSQMLFPQIRKILSNFIASGSKFTAKAYDVQTRQDILLTYPTESNQNQTINKILPNLNQLFTGSNEDANINAGIRAVRISLNNLINGLPPTTDSKSVDVN